MKMLNSIARSMIIFLTVVCVLLSANPGFAQDFQNHEDILETARQFVMDQTARDHDKIEITLGKIDARMHLHRCNQTLEAFKSPGSHLLGHSSIGVRCNGTTPWKLYVPVKISIYENVLVAKRYLRRGVQIQQGDIELQKRDLASMNRGYLTQTRQVVGMILRQPAMADAVLNPAMLEAKKLVHRGESVIILAKNEGFEVRMKGKALDDGVSGEIIQVQNLVSKRIVEGEVVSRGVISVPM